MPMMLRVGFSKKVGQPGFGSIGASVGVELEADASLLDRDGAALAARVRAAFDACRRAVAEELERAQAAVPAGGAAALPGPETEGDVPGRATPGEPPARGPAVMPASEKQAKAIRAIARRSGADLASILRRDYGVERPEDLTVGRASRLIDELKAEGRF